MEVREDSQAVRRFVERFAVMFNDLGFPRMPARVLGALMVTHEPGLTAGTIAESLSVSPAAVSGAVRYLINVGLIDRIAVPGSRSDVYRVPMDVWYSSAVRTGTYTRLADMIDEGVEAVGGDETVAGDRLADTRDFMVFIADEFARLLEQWPEVRAEYRRRWNDSHQ